MPKLGTFIVKQPSGVIIFSELMRNDDGVLRSLLMAYGAKELEATGMIDRFVFEIRHAITTNGKYRVDGFGDFSADSNNTISFTYAHKQQIFGGNIKPPISILEQRKSETLGTNTTIPTPRHTPHATRRVVTGSTTEENTSLIKPDNYLRGLKYDNHKKKRDDSGRVTSRANRGRTWLMTLFVIAIVAGVGALLWLQEKAVTPTITDIEDEMYIEDYTQDYEPIIDSLFYDDTLDSNTTQITINE